MNRTRSAKPGIGRKGWTLIGVGVLLVGAVAANLLLKAPGRAEETSADGTFSAGDSAGAEAAATSATMGFFESFRAERDATRTQEITYIDTVIAQGADAETMADAQQQKLTIVQSMEKEMTIESLLKAKGFADAAVTLHSGSVNVVLSAEALSDEQVAQVLDIVIRETDEKAENIKVTTAQ